MKEQPTNKADYLAGLRRFIRKIYRKAKDAAPDGLGGLKEMVVDQLGPIWRTMFYSNSRRSKHDNALKPKRRKPREKTAALKVFPNMDGTPQFFWDSLSGSAIEVEVDRGEGFQPLIVTKQQRFKDEHPQPARQTKWRYRAREKGTDEWPFSATITVPKRTLEMKA